MVKADRSAYKLFVVGDKGSVALSRSMTDILDSAITNINTPINFPTGSLNIIQLHQLHIKLSSTLKIATELLSFSTSSRMLSVQSRERWR
jgi:hypothetical protein